MRPIEISITNQGGSSSFTTAPIVLDTLTNAQGASIIVHAANAGSSATLSMEASNSDPFAPNFSPSWISVPGAFSNSGNITSTQPVSATLTNSLPRMIRFLASACIGSPQVTFRVTQGGIGGV